MMSLDPGITSSLDPNLALGRIKKDVLTDFIIAPHYSAVYENVGDELWRLTRQQLNSGIFEPSLPIVVEVPKRSGLTRPGAILEPTDRFVYQAIVDLVAPKAETQLDRSKVFSNVLLRKDPSFEMFQPNSASWAKFNDALRDCCSADQWKFAIKTDVANFFERLYQHNLVNALHSAGCQSKAVTFLESLLSTWMEKDSHGILQGMFPSDFLGNFALCGVDSDLIDRDVQFVRYVDDLYLFFNSLDEARLGLVDLCRCLRNEGLHLNESKTKIVRTDALLREETEIDQMFEEAREEIESEEFGPESYGFVSMWSGEEYDEEEAAELRAVEALYQRVADVPDHQAENIEKFCLPLLSATGSPAGVERSLEGISKRPHMAQVYCSYLSKLVTYNPTIAGQLSALVRKENLLYDWQLMWPVAALINVSSVSDGTVRAASRILRANKRSIALRALCAIFLGKHGNAGQRRNLRDFYSEETSPYVRGAILFATRYFPATERRTCLRAWRGHSVTNGLIAGAVQKIA